MELNRILNEFDIKVIKKLTKEEQIILADNVATKISNRFNYIDYGHVYSKLMAAKIYVSIIPKGLTRAIYLYEEDTLFISDEESIDDVSEELLYESIHAAQDVRNKRGKIKQLGQCIFTDFKVYAMALNEVSIQYIVSKVFEIEEKYVEAYGLKAKTYGINKYPLICNILKQLLFLSNEETLVKSTIYSNDDFIIDGIENIGEANYKNIQKNLDDMLYASEEIIGIKRGLESLSDSEEDEQIKKDETTRMTKIEELIRKLYLDCQMCIFTSYFDRLFNRLENVDDIVYYRNKLEDYKELLGYNAEDDNETLLDFYKKYYDDKDQELIQLEADFQRQDDLALTVVPDNPIVRAFNRIKASISRIINRA